MFAHYHAFFRKIGPRSLPARFWFQKGSQKAPKSGPARSREPSFFGAVFRSLFWPFLAPFRTIFGSLLVPRSSAEAPFFGHFSGSSFRTVPGGSPVPLFIDFWSHFRPRGSLFHHFFIAFSSFFLPNPVPPPHQVYPPGHTHKSRTTPRPLRFPRPHAQAPPALPLFESSHQRLLPKISHPFFGAGGAPAPRAQSARPPCGGRAC